MLILCNIHLRYIIPWYAQLSFWIKESDHDVKLNWKDIIDIHLWNNKDNHPEGYVMYKLKNMWFIFAQIESILSARERSIFYFLFYFILFYFFFFSKLPLFLTIICNRKWIFKCVLTLSWRRSLSYRNQSIDLRVSIW